MFWVSSRRLSEIGQLLGELNAAIVLWSTGVLSDKTFADPGRSPAEIVESTAASNGGVGEH